MTKSARSSKVSDVRNKLCNLVKRTIKMFYQYHVFVYDLVSDVVWYVLKTANSLRCSFLAWRVKKKQRTQDIKQHFYCLNICLYWCFIVYLEIRTKIHIEDHSVSCFIFQTYAVFYWQSLRETSLSLNNPSIPVP